MTRVVITAGASGIGRAVAEAFLSTGARVAVCDIDPDAVADFQATHTDALALVADVANESQMAKFFGAVEAEFGGADVVFANAGTGGPAGLIETLNYDDWQACLAANLNGAFLTCRWAARVMRPTGRGLIVLTSSTAGQLGYPHRSPYATAKWGVIGLMKTLAMELGPAGIRVNAICPGAVEGPRMDRVIANEAKSRGIPEKAVRSSYVTGVSLKTWVKADDIAAMVQFLASEQGAKISGQAIAIDGHTETLAP